MSDRAVAATVPGDKSITHRALLLAALADGESRLRGLLAGGDPRATADVLRALGVDVPPLPPDGAAVRVRGRGLSGLRPPEKRLDCRNSGTTARLLLGILAGFPFAATVTGDESLRARPMRRVTEPLSRMGAGFTELGRPDRLPIRVVGGPLKPLQYAGVHASAQVKTALLLAGLTGGAEVRVTEPRASRDHSERMLDAMGVPVRRQFWPDGRHTVSVEPVRRLEPLDLVVPGDFSSAAFPAALALLAGGRPLRIRGVGVNPTRAGLLPVLERMGADIRVDGRRTVCGEPVGDLVVRPGPLRGTTVDGAEIPAMLDEVPVLAVLASLAEGETRITGAEELRVKESDRLAALARNLRALGADAEELPDGLVVRGGERPLRGEARSFGDHRIAMAFGVLAALPIHDVRVDDFAIADISFPGYRDELRRLATELAA